ncbi:MAG TPA: MCP four helix bundle domain-containing protein, partial [Leptospiraceae bacterium]|nr:MCP four helix bundle domain-containing protein [Leptospiraceae bacterium]
MLNLKDLSIKSKLILSVGIFQVLSLIIAILGTMGLSRMEKELLIVSDIFVNIEVNLNDLKFTVDSRRLALLRALNTDSQAEFDKEMTLVKKYESEFKDNIPKIRKF